MHQIKVKEMEWPKAVVEHEKEKNSQFLRDMLGYESLPEQDYLGAGAESEEELHVIFMEPLDTDEQGAKIEINK